MINELLAVDALAPDDVWAVGFHSDGAPDYVQGTPVPGSERPLILHWDGQSWQQFTVPEVGAGNTRFAAVDASAPDDVWAVGYHGGSESSESRPDKSRILIMHWDGRGWRVVPTKSLDVTGVDNRLYGIVALSSEKAWAVGHTGGGYDWSRPDAPIWNTFILQWDGREWSRVSSPNPGNFGNQLFGISAVNSDDIWVIGRLFPNG
jgi:hypothetical protein